MIAVGFLGDGIGARTTLVLADLLAGALTLLSVIAIPGLRDPERDAPGALDEPAREDAEP